MQGTVVRPFVEPASAFGPGHRGVDVAASPGTPVVAAGRGTVVFAGAVAGALHVVVLHRAGLRTSYSFLLDTAVAQGDRVDGGSLVGHAGGTDPDGAHLGVVHFGLRVGERYVDPLLVLQPTDLRDLVRLVPDDEAHPAASPVVEAAQESVLLVHGFDPGLPAVGHGDSGCGGGIPAVGAVVRAVCTGVDWAAGRSRDAFHAGLAVLRGAAGGGKRIARVLGPVLEGLYDEVRAAGALARQRLLDSPIGRVLRDLVEMGERFVEWTRRECSGGAPPADGSGGSGHHVMAVAGIDSSSAGANRRSFGLDVAALGYRHDEIHWFSYAADGGRYGAADTHGDLRLAAKRLADQLRAVDAAHPGREVDLIAHSQGGVVVEQFLRFEYDASDPSLPPLGTVVTLSSPHRGAPLATTARNLTRNPLTAPLVDGLDALLPGPPSDAVSVRQLAAESPFLRRLRSAPMPDHVDLTTIGATDDVVVPANRIRVPGATEVVVDVGGLGDHTRIHRDDRALQVVRAALEQRPPPCTSVVEGLRAAVEPVLVSRIESELGAVGATDREEHR